MIVFPIPVFSIYDSELNSEWSISVQTKLANNWLWRHSNAFASDYASPVVQSSSSVQRM